MIGKPQLSATSHGYKCSERNLITGVCLSTSEIQEEIQVSYFSYYAYPTNNKNKNEEYGDISITVIPYCDITHNNANDNDYDYSNEIDCAPGCDCNPLILFMKSCSQSKCNEIDSHPSSIIHQNDNSLIISSTSTSTTSKIDSTMFIDTSNSINCNPNKLNEMCIYYFAIETTFINNINDINDIASFKVILEKPGMITTIPCELKSPDGMRQVINDNLYEKPFNRYYDLCINNNPNNNIKLNIEQCSGYNEVLICPNNIENNNICETILPNNNNNQWKYLINKNEICIQTNNEIENKSNKQIKCETNMNGLELSNNLASNNIYLMTNGSGSYNLHFQNQINNIYNNPLLIINTYKNKNININSINNIIITKIFDNFIELQFSQVEVIFPLQTKTYIADNIIYTIYAIDTNNYNQQLLLTINKNIPILTTQCGLDYAATMYPESVSIIEIQQSSLNSKNNQNNNENIILNVKFPNLKYETNYQFYMIASCDSNCLSLVSKTNLNGESCRDSIYGCQTQYFVYNNSMEATTLTQQPSTNKHGKHFIRTFIAVTIVMILVIILICVALYSYYKKSLNLNNNDPEQQYKMTEMVSSHDTSTHESDSSQHGLTARQGHGHGVLSFDSEVATGYVPPIINDNLHNNNATTTISDLWTNSTKSMNSFTKKLSTKGYIKLPGMTRTNNNDNDNEDEIIVHL